jgi:hypothetical protein
MTLEAAFGPDGAVCVAHPRLADLASLDGLARGYPRLRGHLGEDCDEHAAALLFVRSVGWVVRRRPPARCGRPDAGRRGPPAADAGRHTTRPND